MSRITTPLDDIIAAVLLWLDGAWFVWASVLAAIALVICAVAVSKVRARSRARIPQYRRTAS